MTTPIRWGILAIASLVVAGGLDRERPELD